jgi:hypothetical protein
MTRPHWRSENDAGACIERGGQSQYGALTGGDVGPYFSRTLGRRRKRDQGERGTFGGLRSAGGRFGGGSRPREDETQGGGAGTELGENLLGAGAQFIGGNCAGNANDDVSGADALRLLLRFFRDFDGCHSAACL